MIDQAAVFAANVLVFQGLLHGDGVGGEGVEVVAGDAQVVLGDQEEPVAAPGDVAGHAAVARYLQADGLAVAVGRHVAHAHRAVVVQRRLDGADRRLDLVHAGFDPAQVGEGHHQADGAVAAHAQVAAVVEEDHPGAGLGIDRLAVQRADQHIAAARLQHAGGAPVVMPFGENLPALGHAAGAEVGETVQHQPGGFAAGVGIEDADAFHAAT